MTIHIRHHTTAFVLFAFALGACTSPPDTTTVRDHPPTERHPVAYAGTRPLALVDSDRYRYEETRSLALVDSDRRRSEGPRRLSSPATDEPDSVHAPRTIVIRDLSRWNSDEFGDLDERSARRYELAADHRLLLQQARFGRLIAHSSAAERDAWGVDVEAIQGSLVAARQAVRSLAAADDDNSWRAARRRVDDRLRAVDHGLHEPYRAYLTSESYELRPMARVERSTPDSTPVAGRSDAEYVRWTATRSDELAFDERADLTAMLHAYLAGVDTKLLHLQRRVQALPADLRGEVTFDLSNARWLRRNAARTVVQLESLSEDAWIARFRELDDQLRDLDDEVEEIQSAVTFEQRVPQSERVFVTRI